MTGVPVGATEDNLKSAIEGETYEYTEMYPGFAKTARDEGFAEIAEWLETLAKAEKSHAGGSPRGSSRSPRSGGPVTATYDPTDPKYFDPAALREELDRVFDLCHGCRLCFNLCPSFPSLFDFIDENDGDVTKLTDAQRDQVVDECYQCKLCYVKCPYVPPHEWELDFPRLMSRVHAVRQKQLVGVRERVTDQFLGRTDALGRASVVAEPVVNWAIGTPGSWTRKLMEKTVGHRLGAPPAALRQAALHDLVQDAGRAAAAASRAGGKVAVFPTCFVEYMEPDVGKAIVGGLRAQRCDLLGARRHQVLRGALAALGQGGAVREGGPAQRGRAGLGGAGGQGRGGGPAHLRLRAQEGLPDLRGDARRRAGGGAHLSTRPST